MPEHPAVELAERQTATMLQREQDMDQRLAAAYAVIYARLRVLAQAVEADMLAMDRPTVAKVKRLDSYRRLLAEIEREMSEFAIIARNEMQQQAQRAAIDAGNHAQQMAFAGVPEPVTNEARGLWNKLDDGAIIALLGFLTIGGPLYAALAEYGGAVRDSVAESVSNDVGLGRRNIGTTITNILGRPLAWVLRAASVALFWTYREALRANYTVNPALVDGWIWWSQLAPNTCMSCISLHGTFFPNSETLNDHPRGHCKPVPVSRLPGGINPRDFEGAGREWFEGLSPAQQRQFFPTPAMANAWEAGSLSWDDLSREREHETFGVFRNVPSLKEILGDGAQQFYVRQGP